MITEIKRLPQIQSFPRFPSNKNIFNFHSRKKFGLSSLNGKFLRFRVKRKGYSCKRYFKYRAYFQQLLKHADMLKKETIPEKRLIKFERYSKAEHLDAITPRENYERR